MLNSGVLRVTRLEDTLIVAPQRNVTSLSGEGVRAEMRALLHGLVGDDIKRVVIDCSQMVYFGSAMLEAMLSLARRLSAHDGHLALCNVSPEGREILEIARFDTLWPIFSTQREALEAGF